MRPARAAWPALLGLAVVILAAAAVLGPDLLRARVARAAERALHRPVAIGALSLRPAWPPVLQASDVVVTGLGQAARVEAQLAAGSLLDFHPRIERVVLLRPILTLTPDAQGEYRLLPPRPEQRPQSSSAPGGHAKTGAPPLLVVQDGTLVLDDPRLGAPLRLAFAGSGTRASYDVSLGGIIPPGSRFPLLTDAALAVHVGADGRIAASVTRGGAVLAGNGVPGGIWAVSLHAPDLRALWPQAPAGPVAADAQLAVGADGYTLRQVRAEGPLGDLTGDLGLSRGANPSLHGTLRAQRLDLDALLAALGRRSRPTDAPPAPATPTPPVAAPHWLIPDRVLPYAALQHGDADLQLAAGVLHFGGVDYHDLSGHVLLQGGLLQVAPFHATLPGGAALDATLRVHATPAATALTLHAPAVALAPLLAALGLPAAAEGTAALDASLRGRGDTLHALASTLDGTASLHVGAAAVDSGVLAGLLGAARLPIRLPPGRTAIHCLALGAAARGGVADISPLSLDADRLHVDGAGSLDLAHETMAVQLLPTLRTGPGLEIPVRLIGSWRAPKIAIGQGEAIPASAACPFAAEPSKALGKAPKPIDLLRSLLR